jgi:hypothetical protein
MRFALTLLFVSMCAAPGMAQHKPPAAKPSATPAEAAAKPSPAPTHQSTADAKPTAASRPSAPPPAQSEPKQETLDEIVARVQRRLATNPPRTQRPPPSSPASAPPAPPAPVATRRITLVWRPTIVWPADLIATSPAPVTPGEAAGVTPR